MCLAGWAIAHEVSGDDFVPLTINELLEYCKDRTNEIYMPPVWNYAQTRYELSNGQASELFGDSSILFEQFAVMKELYGEAAFKP